MCQFLVGNNGLFSLSKTHQYYRGFVSQMGITGIHYCYIFVWTMKDLSVKKITFNKKFWYYVKTNSDIFCKSFVCPVLLGYESITYCASCDKVLLEE